MHPDIARLDKIGVLADAANTAIAQLGQIVSGVSIEQVNHAINQMDQATQQNAALAEEAAAAAQTMAQQAQVLCTCVAIFKLDGEPAAGLSPKPPVADSW